MTTEWIENSTDSSSTEDSAEERKALTTKKRSRADDETENDGDEGEVRRLEAKREYNRRNAARNRQRQKQLVAHLKNKDKINEDLIERLEKENVALRGQVQALQQQIVLIARLNKGAAVSDPLLSSLPTGIAFPPLSGLNLRDLMTLELMRR